MSLQDDMREPRTWARIAGICWLFCIACGVYAEGFVRARLIVHGDSVITIHNVIANEAVYRLATAAEFLGTAAYLVLTPILYVLLAPVNKTISLIAASFSIVGCTIWIAGVAQDIIPFVIFGSLHGEALGPTPAMQSLAIAFIRLQEKSLGVGMICFGVQCFLVGLLIVKSTFIPKVLGFLLAIGGAGYVITSLSSIAFTSVWPFLNSYGNQPGAAGEVLIAMWLTFAGVNEVKWKTQTRARHTRSNLDVFDQSG